MESTYSYWNLGRLEGKLPREGPLEALLIQGVRGVGDRVFGYGIHICRAHPRVLWNITYLMISIGSGCSRFPVDRSGCAQHCEFFPHDIQMFVVIPFSK